MKKIKLSTAVALIILSIATTINGMLIVTKQVLNEEYSVYLKEKQEVAKLYEVISVIDELYVGEVNKENALDGAASGYVANMGDQWSYYLSAEQYQEYLDDMQDNLVGIGINVTYDSAKQAILIVSVYDDSPAERVGLQKLDYITAVDGHLVSEVGYAQAVEYVRGQEKTTVSLTVSRNEIEYEVVATRENVKKISVNYDMIDDNVGYVRISEFDANTTTQFTEAVETLLSLGAEGFVFDVRNNPGGLLTELVDTLNYLLPEGNVISTISKAGEEKIYTSDADYLNMPMAVLTNESSISAAEFFAAAIKDYGVGVIVGTNTMGKGYTQQPQQLSDGSAIILSINKYYTPNGENLADIGVTPDILVELTSEEKANYYFLTYETDPQIAKALEEVKLMILE